MASGAGGLVVSDADAPENIARDQEQEACYGKKSIPALSAAEQKQQGIILDAGVGNEEGDDQQEAFPIDVEGIFSMLPRSVRKYVHEFQSLQGEKADGSVNQEQTGKQGGSSGDHENDGEGPGGRPGYAAGPQAVDEHDDGLQKPGGTGEFNFLAEHLKD